MFKFKVIWDWIFTTCTDPTYCNSIWYINIWHTTQFYNSKRYYVILSKISHEIIVFEHYGCHNLEESSITSKSLTKENKSERNSKRLSTLWMESCAPEVICTLCAFGWFGFLIDGGSCRRLIRSVTKSTSSLFLTKGQTD